MINILFVGNLTRAKGIDDLVFVFKKLRNNYQNIKLTVCGDGPLDKILKSDGVLYKGKVKYDSLPEIYKTADIFVSPSKDVKIFGIKVWEEYFSYTLMEAQAAGLPIIATKCGGISEEIDSRNYLITQGDRDGLYNALDGLINDSKKRLMLGEINRRRALEYFDARIQAAATEREIINHF